MLSKLNAMGLLAGVVLGHMNNTSALGQCVELHESERLIVPEPYGNNARVAASDDLIVLSDPWRTVSVVNQGVAYVYPRQGDGWGSPETLVASDATEGDFLGMGLATDGTTIVVGAPYDTIDGVAYNGSAYVFRHIDGRWTQEAKLVPSDLSGAKNFGWDAEVLGDVVVITTANGGTNGGGLGHAYVFTRQDGTPGVWTQQQKLVLDPGPDPTVRPHHLSVAMSETEILLGGAAVGLGSAYVFVRIGDSWVQQQRLMAPSPALGDAFGKSVAMAGDLAIVGAPTTPHWSGPVVGFAHVFNRGKAGWEHAQTLSGTADASFGECVATRDGSLMVGAPWENDRTYLGAIHVFDWNGTAAVERYRLVATQPWSITTMAERFALTRGFIVGTGRTVAVHFSTLAWLLLFDEPAADCNRNGTPDQCEADCNANQRADECDITSNFSGDCNFNGVPDECEATEAYVVDHGIAGGFNLGGLQPRDHLWLNAFGVRAGEQTLTHIALPWSPSSPSFTPVKVLVYDDPNNDGNPNDAVLLASADAVMLITDDEALPPMARIAIDPTYVGEPGDSFFIGAYVRCESDSYPITIDAGTSSLAERSWYLGSPVGTTILDDLSKNSAVPNRQPQWNWILRGIAIDCNGNGDWDQCDIDNGMSRDADGDGLPDECAGPCPPDLTVDGNVNIDDLLLVIEHWGRGAPGGGSGSNPADANGDGTVDISDLLMVIVNWGPC